MVASPAASHWVKCWDLSQRHKHSCPCQTLQLHDMLMVSTCKDAATSVGTSTRMDRAASQARPTSKRTVQLVPFCGMSARPHATARSTRGTETAKKSLHRAEVLGRCSQSQSHKVHTLSHSCCLATVESGALAMVCYVGAP